MIENLQKKIKHQAFNFKNIALTSRSLNLDIDSCCFSSGRLLIDAMLDLASLTRCLSSVQYSLVATKLSKTFSYSSANSFQFIFSFFHPTIPVKLSDNLYKESSLKSSCQCKILHHINCCQIQFHKGCICFSFYCLTSYNKEDIQLNICFVDAVMCNLFKPFEKSIYKEKKLTQEKINNFKNQLLVIRYSKVFQDFTQQNFKQNQVFENFQKCIKNQQGEKE